MTKCELINTNGDCTVFDLPCKDVFKTDCKHALATKNLDKAIKGMEFCSQIAGCKKECPYNDGINATCMVTLRKDVLQLLREYKNLLSK